MEDQVGVIQRIAVNADNIVVDNLLFLGRATCQNGDFTRAGMLICQSLEQIWSANNLPRIPSRLEGLAEVALGQGNHHIGAILLGAANQQRQVMGAPLWPVEKSAYGMLLSGLKTGLGNSEFQRAREKGAMMSVEQSVAFALVKGT